MDINKQEYAAQKKDENSKVYEAIDMGVDKIFTSQEYFNYYLEVSAQFRKFNANNVVLTVLQNKDATDLRPADEWKDLGAYIKKGEKGLSLIVSDGEYIKSDGTKGIKYKVEKGFDVSQVELNKPLEAEAKLPLADMIKENIINLMGTSKIKIERASEGINIKTVAYDQKNDKIVYSPGIKIMQLYKNYLIASSHAQIAHQLVREKKITSTAEYDQTLYEPQAKATSFIVAGRHGIYYNDLKIEAYQVVNVYKDASSFKNTLYRITADANYICSKMSKDKNINIDVQPREEYQEKSEKSDKPTKDKTDIDQHKKIEEDFER